jgi:hypothetical protein
MITTGLEPILLNYWIKELRLLQDDPIPVTLQEWKKVDTGVGE